MEPDLYRPVGDWAERAACKGMTDVFFPARKDQHKVRIAQQVCGSCQVHAECFDHALHNWERYGIRAGLGPKKLSKERIKRGIDVRQTGELAHGTRSKYVRGCRCEACREAQKTYQKKWRETR